MIAPARRRRARYLGGLDTVLHGAGLPYGYTVTIWSTGGLLVWSQGSPDPASVFLFAAGAAAAYGLLKVITRNASGDPRKQLTGDRHLLRAGAIHVVAIGLAIGAAALVALIDTVLAWALGTFAATLVYLSATAVDMALEEGTEWSDLPSGSTAADMSNARDERAARR